MNKVFIGIGMTGITSAAAFLQLTKHVHRVSVPSPADAPALKPLLDHARPLHIDVCQVHVPSNVSARQFARAFFTSPVFRVERRILQAFGAGSSVSDEEIKRMDFVVGDRVAIFEVVDCQLSHTEEILLCWNPSSLGHSWMEAKPSTDTEGGTTLSFGSVLDVKQRSLDKMFIPFHLMYAKIVLASAHQQLAALNSVKPTE
jgi:hypothetical protein